MADYLSAGEVVEFPKSDYLYIEKIGSFMTTAPLAWQELHGIIHEKLDPTLICSMAGLSRVEDEKSTYQAGVFVSALFDPNTLPEGVQHRRVPHGKFLKFLLAGSYSLLAEAYPLAFERRAEGGYQERDEGAFAMEIYLNNPSTEPNEALLQTEIYLPIL
jgi:predicted transcriptional regulator YdeE